MEALQPLVSICIPCYNMARYVGVAIESALQQTWSNLEVVVVDNASTDASWAVIQDWAARDRRVRALHYDELVRMPANWNRSLGAARGEYVNLLSADDALAPGFVEHCLSLFTQQPDIGYVFTERRLLDADGNLRDEPPFYQTSAVIPGLEEGRLNLIGSHTAPSQVLIRRACLDTVGFYDERFDWAFDMHMLLKLNLRYDVGYVQDALCHYRIHPEMSSSRFSATGLGAMEIYRLKLSILDDLPPHARSLASCRKRMLENLAGLCIAQAATSIDAEALEQGGSLLNLARCFWPQVVNVPRFRELWACTGQEMLPPAQPLPQSPAMHRPYPLPNGSTTVASNAA